MEVVLCVIVLYAYVSIWNMLPPATIHDSTLEKGNEHFPMLTLGETHVEGSDPTGTKVD